MAHNPPTTSAATHPAINPFVTPSISSTSTTITNSATTKDDFAVLVKFDRLVHQRGPVCREDSRAALGSGGRQPYDATVLRVRVSMNGSDLRDRLEKRLAECGRFDYSIERMSVEWNVLSGGRTRQGRESLRMDLDVMERQELRHVLVTLGERQFGEDCLFVEVGEPEWRGERNMI